MKSGRFILLLMITGFLAQGCDIKVNKSIEIRDGERIRKNLTTVNGNIIIGADCNIIGKCRTINGIIEVGPNSIVRAIQSVNGSIEVSENATVKRSINSVNAPVECRAGAKIGGEISVVNGRIDLANTTVAGNIITYNGDVLLTDSSFVQGDLVVKMGKGSSDRHRPLLIEIVDNAIVSGDVVVRDPEMQVLLKLARGGQVRGQIRNAEVVRE